MGIGLSMWAPLWDSARRPRWSPNSALHMKKIQEQSQCREDRPGRKAGRQLEGLPNRPTPNTAKAKPAESTGSASRTQKL